MNWGNFFSVLRDRIGILIAVVVVAALAAVPAVVNETRLYSSKIGVIVPSTVPLPGVKTVKPSEIAIRMRAYAEGNALEEDVRAELSEQGSELDEVIADQNADLNTYVLTATAESSDLAQEGARIGAQKIIEQGDVITGGLVDKLEEQFEQEAETLGPDLSELQNEVRELTFDIADLRERVKALTARINQTENVILRHEAADATRLDIEELRQAIEQARETRAPLNAKLRSKIAERNDKAVELRLLQARRSAVTGIVERAVAIRLAHLAASNPLTEPSNPERGNLADIVTKEAVAVLVGLLVGIAVVVLLERRRIFTG